MKLWLNLSEDEDYTLLELLNIANSQEEWRVSDFYSHFTPLMALVIDGEL